MRREMSEAGIELTLRDEVEDLGVAPVRVRGRADELELVVHHQVGRQRDLALLGLRGEADLHVAAAAAQGGDAGLGGRRGRDRVDADGDSAAARDLLDAARNVHAFTGLNRLKCAGLPRAFELRRVDVDRDHAPAQRGGGLDRR